MIPRTASLSAPFDEAKWVLLLRELSRLFQFATQTHIETYTGTGTKRTLRLPFSPTFVGIVQAHGVTDPGGWPKPAKVCVAFKAASGVTYIVGDNTAVIDGVTRFDAMGIEVGVNVAVNGSGAKYLILATA